MAISVILYKNRAPKNQVDKKSALSSAKTISGVRFTEASALDVKNPSVLVEITDDIGDMTKYNYAYISDLNRYYYITKITTEGALIRIDLDSDSLMSFKDDILSSTQYVLRSEISRSAYLQDSKIPIRSNKKIISKSFGDDIYLKSCPYVILETTGTGGVVV